MTPGSPTLNNFGPEMLLAKELLEAGDQPTVLKYLRLCQEFWKDDGELNFWIDIVERGEIPDFEHVEVDLHRSDGESGM